jgi:hypothetical protein
MKLPDRPNLRHLRDQAKDLVRAGATSPLADAQLQIARQYGFASWPRLKQHVESLEQAGQLKHAIECNAVSRVDELLTSSAALRQLVRDDECIMPTRPGPIPMMELLWRYGASVNGLWPGPVESTDQQIDASPRILSAMVSRRCLVVADHTAVQPQRILLKVARKLISGGTRRRASTSAASFSFRGSFAWVLRRRRCSTSGPALAP